VPISGWHCWNLGYVLAVPLISTTTVCAIPAISGCFCWISARARNADRGLAVYAFSFNTLVKNGLCEASAPSTSRYTAGLILALITSL